MDTRYSRFSDAPWFKDETKENIIIGGAGGIGSWVSFFLSRIGHNLTIFDMDTVDETNMAGQFYENKSVGSSKVNAVKEIIDRFSGCEVTVNQEKYDNESISSSIVVSCFDNMESRRVMFERWLKVVEYYQSSDFYKEELDKCLFVDGRMTAEQGHIYFVKPDMKDRYLATIFDDSEAQELPCSLKATTHNGSMIASQIVAGINNHLSNSYAGFNYRSVPFYIKYMLETFLYEVEV